MQGLATTSKGWPLTSASIGSGPTKVLLTFGIHGREYMTSEIAVHFLNQLCSGEEDALLKEAAQPMEPQRVTEVCRREPRAPPILESSSLTHQDQTQQRESKVSERAVW